MATVIRMKRGGRTHAPYYRIVVMDGRARTRGREVDQLGVYQPCARPEPVTEIDVQKALQWLRNGAQPSDTAKSMLRRIGVLKHVAEGTTPEEQGVVVFKGGVVEDKGYNAPPPPKEEPPAKKEAAEAPAEEKPAETAETAAETEGEAETAEAAEETEEKSE